jgi:hypothetical protein
VACVSNALTYEYLDVLSRKLSAARWLRLQPVVGPSWLRPGLYPSIFRGGRCRLTLEMIISFNPVVTRDTPSPISRAGPV